MPTEEQLQEIHRLAVLGDVADIAQDVGPRLTGPLAGHLPFSRGPGGESPDLSAWTPCEDACPSRPCQAQPG